MIFFGRRGRRPSSDHFRGRAVADLVEVGLFFSAVSAVADLVEVGLFFSAVSDRGYSFFAKLLQIVFCLYPRSVVARFDPKRVKSKNIFCKTFANCFLFISSLRGSSLRPEASKKQEYFLQIFCKLFFVYILAPGRSEVPHCSRPR